MVQTEIGVDDGELRGTMVRELNDLNELSTKRIDAGSNDLRREEGNEGSTSKYSTNAHLQENQRDSSTFIKRHRRRRSSDSPVSPHSPSSYYSYHTLSRSLSPQPPPPPPNEQSHQSNVNWNAKEKQKQRILPTERTTRNGGEQDWVRIEFEGFEKGTRKEFIESLLSRTLKFWRNLEVCEEGGRKFGFSVHGMKTARSVERQFEGWKLGNGDGRTVRVWIIEKREGEKERGREVEEEDQYGPPSVATHEEEKKDDAEERTGERGRKRGRSSSNREEKQGRSRSRRGESRDRSESRDRRSHRRNKDRNSSRRRSRKYDEEDRSERKSRRKEKKRDSSHRSRSRSPRLHRHSHRSRKHRSISSSRSRSRSRRRHHRSHKRSRRRRNRSSSSSSSYSSSRSPSSKRHSRSHKGYSRSRSRSPRRKKDRYDKRAPQLSNSSSSSLISRDLRPQSRPRSQQVPTGPPAQQARNCKNQNSYHDRSSSSMYGPAIHYGQEMDGQRFRESK